MATNPRVPTDEPTTANPCRPQLVPALSPERPASGISRLWVAIVIAVALAFVVRYYRQGVHMNSARPSEAEAPAQTSGSELQVTGLKMAMVPSSSAMNLDGQVTNSGARTVWGVMVRLTFRDAGGNVEGTATVPLTGMKNEAGTLVNDEFAFDPLKRNDTRPFQAIVNGVPAGWDRTTPEIKVLTETTSGN